MTVSGKLAAIAEIKKINMNQISWTDFSKIDMRIGTIISAEIFKEVKKPALKLIVDFGELGKRKTSAQITKRYKPENLIEKQVVGVINFAKQIANIMSECLILGGVGEDNDMVIIQPETEVKNGMKIG